MQAAIGDRLVVRSPHIDSEVSGEVVEVQGDDGAPPYVVQWDHDGNRALFFPGPELVVRLDGEPAPDSGPSDARP